MSGRLGAALAVLLWLAPAAAPARTFLDQEEALALAFPGAAIERETLYLTEAERQDAARRAGAEVESEVWIRYRARREGRCADPGWNGITSLRHGAPATRPCAGSTVNRSPA